MTKVQGPRNRMMYFRLDTGEADELATIAQSEDRPVADITRRAVKLYLRGGAEKWAEVQAAKERDPAADAIARAIRGDAPLADAVLELAAVAHERQDARSLLLSLARLVAPAGKAPRRRAKGSVPA